MSLPFSCTGCHKSFRAGSQHQAGAIVCPFCGQEVARVARREPPPAPAAGFVIHWQIVAASMGLIAGLLGALVLGLAAGAAFGVLAAVQGWGGFTREVVSHFLFLARPAKGRSLTRSRITCAGSAWTSPSRR